MIVLQFKSLEKMKKLVLVFVAVAAISFASCGNKTNQAAPVDSDSVATPDTAVVDSAAAVAAVWLALLPFFLRDGSMRQRARKSGSRL